MIDEERHIAFPKLYGASGSFRPPRHVAEAARPFDPDDLPLAAHQTDEELMLAPDSDGPWDAAPPTAADSRSSSATGILSTRQRTSILVRLFGDGRPNR